MSPPDSGTAPDAEAVVREIQDEVRRRRAAGEYPPAMLDRIATTFELPRDGSDPELFAVIDSARPLRSNRPVAGPAITLAKRVVRRLLAWYVQPIAHEQTEFNLALLRQLRALETQVAGLASIWAPAPQQTTPMLRAAAQARAQALVHTGADLTNGVAVIGCDSALFDELVRVGVRLSTPPVHDEWTWIQSLARTPQSVVFLAGALPRLTPLEAVNLVKLARHALTRDGVLATDMPLPGPAANDPGVVDITMRRWVAPQSVMLVMELAGLAPTRPVEIAVPGLDAVSWYLAAGTAVQP